MPVPRKLTKEVLRWGSAAIALALYLGFAIWFGADTSIYHLYRSAGSAHVSYEKALVVSVTAQELERDPDSGGLTMGYQDLVVRLLSGDKAGTEVPVRNFLNYTTNIILKKGDGIIAHVDVADTAHFTVSVYSVNRAPILFILALLFVAALCGIGRRKGARSVLGIVFTFSSIVLLFVPMLYRGWSPAIAASAVVILTVCVSLILLDGIRAKTVSAILGSVAGIAVSAVLTLLFQRLTLVSGYTTAEADSLLAIAGRTGMRVGELLFAAFLIATSGAVMDIAISVASSVAEVHSGNPGLSSAELFRSGMNVGRDMMGTMANTLILAFTGASLNTLILIYSLERSWFQILNSNAITIEIIQSLTGSLAVILTVPAVAFISSRLVPRMASRTRNRP
jgi:uncharacterized membrane protein